MMLVFVQTSKTQQVLLIALSALLAAADSCSPWVMLTHSCLNRCPACQAGRRLNDKTPGFVTVCLRGCPSTDHLRLRKLSKPQAGRSAAAAAADAI